MKKVHIINMCPILDGYGVDLKSPCFSHGQLYVACSRVGSHKNLFILASGGETKNVVYNQVLS
jgi:hypothetical protein